MIEDRRGLWLAVPACHCKLLKILTAQRRCPVPCLCGERLAAASGAAPGLQVQHYPRSCNPEAGLSKKRGRNKSNLRCPSCAPLAKPVKSAPVFSQRRGAGGARCPPAAVARRCAAAQALLDLVLHGATRLAYPRLRKHSARWSPREVIGSVGTAASDAPAFGARL